MLVNEQVVQVGCVGLCDVAAQTEDVCHHLKEHSRSSRRSHQDSLFSRCHWINICTAHFGSPYSFMGHRHGPPDSFGTPAFHPDAAAALPSLHRVHALFSFSSLRPLDMLGSTPAAPTALRGAIAACQTAQSLRRRLASCTRLKTFQKAWDDRAPSLLLYPAMTRRPDIFTVGRFLVIHFNNCVRHYRPMQVKVD